MKLKKFKLNRKTIALLIIVCFLCAYFFQKSTGMLGWLQLLDFGMIAIFDADGSPTISA
jgi:hypothetical protein